MPVSAMQKKSLFTAGIQMDWKATGEKVLQTMHG
jgi:hypothetical protein